MVARMSTASLVVSFISEGCRAELRRPGGKESPGRNAPGKPLRRFAQSRLRASAAETGERIGRVSCSHAAVSVASNLRPGRTSRHRSAARRSRESRPRDRPRSPARTSVPARPSPLPTAAHRRPRNPVVATVPPWASASEKPGARSPTSRPEPQDCRGEQQRRERRCHHRGIRQRAIVVARRSTVGCPASVGFSCVARLSRCRVRLPRCTAGRSCPSPRRCTGRVVDGWDAAPSHAETVRAGKQRLRTPFPGRAA